MTLALLGSPHGPVWVTLYLAGRCSEEVDTALVHRGGSHGVQPRSPPGPPAPLLGMTWDVGPHSGGGHSDGSEGGQPV